MHTRHSKFVGLLLGAAPSFLNLEPAKEREVKSSQAPGLDSGNFKTFCLGPNHQPGDGEVPKVDGAHKEHTQRDTPYVHMTRCLEPVAQQWIKESRNSDFGDIQHADAQEPSQEGLHRPAERARRGSPGEVDSDGVEDSNLRDRGREGHQQAGSQQDRAADLDQEAQHGFEEEGRPTGLLQDRIGNESHFQRDHSTAPESSDGTHLPEVRGSRDRPGGLRKLQQFELPGDCRDAGRVRSMGGCNSTRGAVLQPFDEAGQLVGEEHGDQEEGWYEQESTILKGQPEDRDPSRQSSIRGSFLHRKHSSSDGSHGTDHGANEEHAIRDGGTSRASPQEAQGGEQRDGILGRREHATPEEPMRASQGY